MGERLTTGEICTRDVTIAFKATTLNEKIKRLGIDLRS